MTEQLKTEQEAFEKWVSDRGFAAQYLGDGQYGYTTQFAWEAWQARASQAQEGAMAELLAELREVRHSLQFANDTPNGGINDTIWMMHRPETVFDCIDAMLVKYGIAAAPAGGETGEG